MVQVAGLENRNGTLAQQLAETQHTLRLLKKAPAKVKPVFSILSVLPPCFCVFVSSCPFVPFRALMRVSFVKETYDDKTTKIMQEDAADIPLESEQDRCNLIRVGDVVAR